MSHKEIPQMTRERWIQNLIDAINDIANKRMQERRWLASDAHVWEHPDELINVLFDDCNFDLFLDENAQSFSEVQREAAFDLRNDLRLFCDATPQHLDAKEVLADPRWIRIRERAAVFIAAFEGKWPTHVSESDLRRI